MRCYRAIWGENIGPFLIIIVSALPPASMENNRCSDAGGEPYSAHGPLQQGAEFPQEFGFIDHGLGAAARTSRAELRTRIHGKQDDSCFRRHLGKQKRRP